MVILEQGPLAPKPPLESATWAEWGLHLQDSHASWCQLGAVPTLEPLQRSPGPGLVLAIERQPLASAESRSDADEASVHGSLEARRDGEAMHAFVRDLLVRWEDPDAFERCLQQAPQQNKKPQAHQHQRHQYPLAPVQRPLDPRQGGKARPRRAPQPSPHPPPRRFR